MNSEVVLDDIVNVTNKSSKIVILTHESPDGDAVGSSLAMYIALKNLKKNVDIVVDEYSKIFDFLPYSSEIKREVKGKYDLAIALDCASKARLYDNNDLFENSNITISIDHHGSNTYFANYNYVIGNSPAACQVLLRVFKRMGISITKEMGECLIAGIITDTGGFRYDSVDSETFEFASLALDLGVNVSDIYIRVFQTKSKSQFMLSQIATGRLELIYKDRIAFTYITMADEKRCKSLKGDHEGIVNVGQSIENVEVSIFLHECEKGYKFSLRSNNFVDVSEIAAIFGGGGHVRAAGGLISANLEDTKKMLIKEVKKAL